MTRAMKTTARVTSRAAEADRWRYGERHLRRVRPNGEVYYETVPLRKEDLLFPQEGDRLVLTDDHTVDYVYLLGVLQASAARHKGRRVFGDHRIDFQVSDIPPLGPDIVVLDGVGEWDGSRGTFPVVTMGSRPLLTIEITSPDTRPNDVEVKPDLYFRCGVQWYAVVDRQSGDGTQVRILAFRAAERGYVEVPPDRRGRVWLESVGLALGVADGRTALYDRRGRKLLAPLQQAAAEAKARRRAEREAAAEVKAREQAEREKSDLQKRIDELEAQLRRKRGDE